MAAYYHCACGKYFTEAKVETTLADLIGETPSHSYGAWKNDANSHWKECSCGKKLDEGSHIDANSNNKCDTCDKTISSGGVIPPVHTHNYGMTWKTDGENHWQECSCGSKKNFIAHIGGTATCKEKAKCSVCGMEYGDFADHIPDADDGDCTTDITCSVCGTVTTEGENTHIGGTATCKEKANCSVCGKEYGDLADEHIPNADDGDCTTDITCSVCGTVTTEGKNIHIGGTATCKEKANCSVCGMEYGDFAEHKYSDATCTAKAECYICGYIIGEFADHKDQDNDGKCDACEYQIASVDPVDPSIDHIDHDGLSAGAIVGVVIGTILVVGLGGFSLLWFVFKKKSLLDLVKVFKK